MSCVVSQEGKRAVQPEPKLEWQLDTFIAIIESYEAKFDSFHLSYSLQSGLPVYCFNDNNRPSTEAIEFSKTNTLFTPVIDELNRQYNGNVRKANGEEIYEFLQAGNVIQSHSTDGRFWLSKWDVGKNATIDVRSHSREPLFWPMLWNGGVAGRGDPKLLSEHIRNQTARGANFSVEGISSKSFIAIIENAVDSKKGTRIEIEFTLTPLRVLRVKRIATIYSEEIMLSEVSFRDFDEGVPRLVIAKDLIGVPMTQDILADVNEGRKNLIDVSHMIATTKFEITDYSKNSEGDRSILSEVTVPKGWRIYDAIAGSGAEAGRDLKPFK